VTANWDGPEVIDHILDTKTETVARFIAKKLWAYLAHPSPSREVLDAITAAFVASDLDIEALVRAILGRPEFYSTKSRHGRVRTPVEFAVAAMQSTHLSASVASPEWWTDAMGQLLFRPPDVSGWKHNRYWISTAAMLARANFARYVTWKASERGFLAHTRSVSPEAAASKALKAFRIHHPARPTRDALAAWIRREREAYGWAEQPNLITLTLLSPDFQLA